MFLGGFPYRIFLSRLQRKETGTFLVHEIQGNRGDKAPVQLRRQQNLWKFVGDQLHGLHSSYGFEMRVKNLTFQTAYQYFRSLGCGGFEEFLEPAFSFSVAT